MTTRWYFGLALLLLAACGEATGDIIIAVDAGTFPDAGASDAGTSPDAGAPGCTDAIEDSADLVKTEFAAYRGVDVGERTRGFFGVRFAAPPTGDGRWAPPAEPECAPAPILADTFGAKCPQLENDQVLGDEDCLFLNVWAPRSLATEPRAVMVFVHGGGNAQGSADKSVGGELIYDGRSLAEDHDVVVVTIQYRLGPLGWLTHPDLPEGGGNFGTLDQIAALRWVQHNIAAFGGDPSRVTIFGESAGARNVCVLVASPLAAGLFEGGIMESGGCVVPSEDDVLAASAEQIAASGCDGDATPIACLRAKSAAQMLRDLPPVISVAGRSSMLQPFPDGRVLLGQPVDEIAEGRHNHVAMIVGANADETAQSAPMVASEAAYEALVRQQFGVALGNRILAAYPVTDYPTPRAAYVALTTDVKFVCGARRDARAFVAGQTAPVYRYHFTQRLTNAPRASAFGAYHGLELAFVFDVLRIGGYVPSPGEEALADTMGTYWTNFARTRDPNGGGAELWPLYDATLDRTQLLGDPVGTQDGIRTPQCDFWDSLGG